MNQQGGQKILFIEDNMRLALLIKDFLQNHDYQVTHLSRGKDVELLADTAHFDLVICDVMLPDISGFELINILRKKIDSQVIFLTAMGKAEDQIQGLELGAMDYIVKPVDPAVLLARVRSCLRRLKPAELDVLTISDLVLDNKSKIAEVDGVRLELTSRDFDLLWVFAQHQGEALNREFLFQAIVGREYNGLDRTIDARTMRLRKKIASFNIAGLSIDTIWGKGYVFTYG